MGGEVADKPDHVAVDLLHQRRHKQIVQLMFDDLTIMVIILSNLRHQGSVKVGDNHWARLVSQERQQALDFVVKLESWLEMNIYVLCLKESARAWAEEKDELIIAPHGFQESWRQNRAHC